MERIEAFEAMLKAALEQSEAERQKMESLKAQGREKTSDLSAVSGQPPVLQSVV